MEKGISHSRRDVARYRHRGLCSCFASTWLDQTRNLRDNFAPSSWSRQAGWRSRSGSGWLIGLPFGTGLGVLYSVTTISGPPLAILFNNQGLVKNEFRAGLALVRVAESSVTAIVYYQLGLFIPESGEPLFGVRSQRCGWNSAWRLCHPADEFRDVSVGYA